MNTSLKTNLSLIEFSSLKSHDMVRTTASIYVSVVNGNLLIVQKEREGSLSKIRGLNFNSSSHALLMRQGVLVV